MRAPGRSWPVLIAGVVICVFGSLRAAAAHPQESEDTLRAARVLYEGACAACHGVDGRGAARSSVGFDDPLPDFSDCSFATREPDADWFAIAHAGGPVRSFARRMPSFGEALSEGDLAAIIGYLRSFCTERSWPRGELNLPRPLVTEKAYPEDEAVLAITSPTGGPGSVETQFLYEKRLGARSQYEVSVPLVLAESGSGQWERGLGDIAVAFKHVLLHSLPRGSILTAGAEAALPTGKETQGLGAGVTRFEPFLALGQVLPSNGFLHAQAGAELSTDRSKAGHEAFWRAAIGRTFEQGQFGRAWSPMVEVIGARELESGAAPEWDIAPQMQVTLSRRQHIMISGGVRIPVNERDERHATVIAYFLWDWYDGGLWDGW